MRLQRRYLVLSVITATLFAGCSTTFHGAIINGTARTLDAVEYVNPNGKRLTFHNLEPYHMKTFDSSFPDGDVRLFWKEGPEGGNKSYGVKLSAERVKREANGGGNVVVLRIEHEKDPVVLVGGVATKDFDASLLQRHGSPVPAHLIEP
jgi:hypothetical protein